MYRARCLKLKRFYNFYYVIMCPFYLSNFDQVTVVGKQSGREIRPFKTENGDELLFLHTGRLRKPTEVFHAEHALNRIHIWLYRLIGWFVSFLGLNCISPLLDIIGQSSNEFNAKSSNVFPLNFMSRSDYAAHV